MYSLTINKYCKVILVEISNLYNSSYLYKSLEKTSVIFDSKMFIVVQRGLLYSFQKEMFTCLKLMRIISVMVYKTYLLY